MAIKQNPYKKTVWFDQIIDVTTGEVIQVGTRFNQSRANNIENGIYNAYEYIISLESTVKRLQAQLEIDGRVPGNGGGFFDTFDGTPSRLALVTTKTDVTADVTVGATKIPVASTDGFTAFTYVTIYDGTNYENVQVTAIGTKELTVTALANGYTKGAKVARSTVDIDAVNQTMDVAPYIVYSVDLVEVV